MDKPEKCPRVVTDYGPLGSHSHLTILVTWRPGDAPIRVCGESWCSGKCGHPAMVVPATPERPEQKMYSAMVALGHVMQRWRVEWKGTKVEAPEEFRANLLEMLWI